MTEYDIVVAGAGPAGATLARLVGRHRRVLMLDRRRLDRDFHPGEPGKCCGGLLSTEGQLALARLGLALPEEVIGGDQFFAVRAIDLPAKLDRCYQRFYWNLDREKFDRWLVRLALEAGDAEFGAEFRGFEDGVVSYRREDGRLCRVGCRYLVAADGAASAVRRRFDPGWRPDRAHAAYVAVQEVMEPAEASPYLHAYFDGEVTDFYGWSIPKRDRWLLGAALTPGRDAVRRYELLKRRLEEYGLRFGRVIRREGALLLRPARRRDLWCGAGNVFAIGEAGGWISPSSAEGFSFAMNTAGLLAEEFLERESPEVAGYRRRAGRLARRLLLKRLKSPVMYHPALRRPVMRSGITAI